jgi:hypothetical protein
MPDGWVLISYGPECGSVDGITNLASAADIYAYVL